MEFDYEKLEESFRKKINDYCEINKVSRNKLALNSGLQPCQINKFLRKEQSLNSGSIQKIAKTMKSSQ